MKLSAYNYGLDGIGNRTSAFEDGVEIANWAHDSVNQLYINYRSDCCYCDKIVEHVVLNCPWASSIQWIARTEQLRTTRSTMAVRPHYGDLYISPVSSLSWMRMTLGQWDLLMLADWDTLPLDATGSFQSGTNSVNYDDAGNRTRLVEESTGDITTYVYDDANRLLTAEDASGVTTYTYDAKGKLLGK